MVLDVGVAEEVDSDILTCGTEGVLNVSKKSIAVDRTSEQILRTLSQMFEPVVDDSVESVRYTDFHSSIVALCLVFLPDKVCTTLLSPYQLIALTRRQTLSDHLH